MAGILYASGLSLSRCHHQQEVAALAGRLCAWAGRVSTGRYALLKVLILQADALAKAQVDRLGELRTCTRKVA